MRIALTADPEIPVPPKHYGGIERIVDMLARGLTARGHEVTLFAHPDSASAGRLVPWPGRVSQSIGDTARNAAALASEVMRGRFDLVHSFARIASLTPILPLQLPKVMSYQRAISRRTTRLGFALSRGTLSFTAISDWMMDGVSSIGRWDLVPNGVPLDTYAFAPNVAKDAPLVFLGRIEEIKGPHLAIDVALRSGRRLVIAGNVPDDKHEWCEANVFSRVDGQKIHYVGPVDDAQKNDLLGQSAALLMPILWDEPFGIVMAEAMACGTPVLGFSRGAVPEVVEDRVTGFVSADLEEMVRHVGALDTIGRQACRTRVEALYSQDAIVERYIEIYHDRLGEQQAQSAV